MSRSVSYASGAFAVAYEDVSSFGYRDEDAEGNKIDKPEYDEVLGSIDWEDFVDNLAYRAKKLWPSLQNCEKWLGSEDKAILENRFAYFGISEYCGLASVWFVLKDDLVEGLAKNAKVTMWANQVEKTFHKNFGTLRKIGTFSNGEAVYERKGA